MPFQHERLMRVVQQAIGKRLVLHQGGGVFGNPGSCLVIGPAWNYDDQEVVMVVLPSGYGEDVLMLSRIPDSDIDQALEQ